MTRALLLLGALAALWAAAVAAAGGFDVRVGGLVLRSHDPIPAAVVAVLCLALAFRRGPVPARDALWWWWTTIERRAGLFAALVAAEEQEFRRRFAGRSALGDLEWPPTADINRQVRIYDPLDREKYQRGDPVETHRVWTARSR